jgi:hypothetical protein
MSLFTQAISLMLELPHIICTKINIYGSNMENIISHMLCFHNGFVKALLAEEQVRHSLEKILLMQ